MAFDNSTDMMEYALRHYLLESVSREELMVDIQRISLINLSLKRFVPGKSPRNLVNQLITVFNTFEMEAAIRMMVSKTDKSMLPRLKAALLTLEVWRDELGGHDIEPDHELMMALNNDLDDWRRLPCQR
uniref:Uncharacterized protein n=1 Tax=Serratia phage Kevin TaxID=3161161 RepID=A0AAU8KXW0_9CAUD